MRIAFLQMDCAEGRPAHNREVVASAARVAAAEGAAILALPELWCSGYDLAAATRVGAAGRAALESEFEALRALSADHGIALLAGSLLEPWDGGFANCAVAYEAGVERNRYRKLHLFRPLHEHRYLRQGNARPKTFEIAGIRAACAICYDLRFPEVFRPLAAGGAQLIFVPAQWPRARIHHWRALLVARAIESQSYVLGVNRLGRFGAIEFPGQSLLVGPAGDVIAAAAEAEGIYYGPIEGAEVERLRRDFPVLSDRRDDQYPLGATARE